MNRHTLSGLDFAPHGDVFPSPADWRDQVIYFLLVDRFDNNQNSPPYDPKRPGPKNDPAQGRLFQGGNLKGIMRRLDYIKDMGATTVWISPVLKNRLDRNDTYHGYGIQNYLEVDPRFGSSDDLRRLADEAHRRGMYIILDIIINHTGDNWAYPGDHPYYYWPEAPGPFPFGYWRQADPAPGLQDDDAVWPVELQSPEWYKRRGQIRNWQDQQEALHGDFSSLKELDLRRSEVLESLIRAYKYWIALTDIDGFRLDTVKHMEDTATAIFCNAIREYARRIGKHNFFLFGEVVGDDAVLQRYIGRNCRFPESGERFPALDACLDFPLYFILEEVIKGFANPALLRDRYERFRTAYADHGAAGQYFVTFVDNHDQMSRPYRRFMHRNPSSAQAMLAVGYLLTSQGVPCIYYGSEQNFDGGGDSDMHVRECMFGGKWGAFASAGHHFFNPNHPTYQGIARIAAVRRQQPALRYGRQYFREISGNGRDFGHPLDGRCTLAFSRILDTTEILVVLNLDSNPRSDWVTIDASLNRPGATMVNLLQPDHNLLVENHQDRLAVRVPLPGHAIALWAGGQIL